MDPASQPMTHDRYMLSYGTDISFLLYSREFSLPLAVLSVFGVALLFISASALGQARMAARAGKEIDAATSLVAQNIGETIWKRILELGSMPANKVAAIGAAIANMLLVPVGMMGKLVLSISKAGGTVLNAVHTVIANIIASPGMAVTIIRNSLLALRAASMQYVASTVSCMSHLPELCMMKTREGLVLLTSIAGTKAASIGTVVYSSTAFQLSQFVNLLKAGFASGTIRSSTSFGIMLKNAVAQGKWQLYLFKDAYGCLLVSILSAAPGLFGHRPRSDIV